MNTESRSIVAEAVSAIGSPSELWLGHAKAHLDSLTKPLGSLGRLEEIAAQLVSIRQDDFAEPLRKAVYIFAADHGITVEGVSAYPSEVTRQMVLNFLSQGAAINVLAKLHHVEMHVIDVGVDADFDEMTGLRRCKIRKGTRNMLREAAMSDDELARALQVGLMFAAEAKNQGQALLAAGEMGIGNTTAASAITSMLTNTPAALVTGAGTGLDASRQLHKRQIIEAIIEKHFAPIRSGSTHDPLDVLRCIGGLEIAAMAGLILGATRYGIAVIIDGFISAVAAAIAFAIEPRVRGFLFAGHQSEEPGHRVLLEYIGLKPILSLNMRLGEGTGAVLAMPIIESAMALYNQMATFAAAGVSEAER
jgi:nicotinate-nucleotide--dimethylbenzimidazole phosphoribosyltransferase